MTVRNSGWEPFSGRVFGSAIDREIGRAFARQGVEQHASFGGGCAARSGTGRSAPT